MFSNDNRDQVVAGDDDAAGDNNARAPLQMIQQGTVQACQSRHHIALLHRNLCVKLLILSVLLVHHHLAADKGSKKHTSYCSHET
jgi:hypothetical protein